MNINHILIQTTDLSEMATFMQNAANLEIGTRPPFPFPGVWMYNDNKPVVHIVEAAGDRSQSDYLGANSLASGGAVEHVAFEGDNYHELIERLTQNGIGYFERTVPLSHEHQVFVNGPDGVKLEILFNQNKHPLTVS